MSKSEPFLEDKIQGAPKIEQFKFECDAKIREWKGTNPPHYWEYYGSGWDTDFKLDIIQIYQDAKIRVEDLKKINRIRIGREESGLYITYHLIKAKDGSIILGFDPNSKFLSRSFLDWVFCEPKVKFVGKGGQFKVRKGFALVDGQIIPTAILVGPPQDKDSLKLILTIDSPFILRYWIGAKYTKKQNRDETKKEEGLKHFVEICPLMDGDLSKFLNECKKPEDFSLSHLLWTIYSLINGVKDLHDQGILHRDLKEKNTLTKKSADHPLPIVKVADLGLACKNNDQKEKTYRSGTYEYFGFDNPHFKELVEYFQRYREYEDGTVSVEDFIYVVNNFKYTSSNSGAKPLLMKKILWISDIPAIQILWEKFQHKELIEFDDYFGDKQEDMFQLLLVCLNVIKKFKELNPSSTLNFSINKKIDKLHSRVEKHLRLARSKRYTAKQFHAFFIRILKGITKIEDPTVVDQLKNDFKDMATNLKIMNPLESKPKVDSEETKKIPQIIKQKTDTDEKKIGSTTTKVPIKKMPTTLEIIHTLKLLTALINSDFWIDKGIRVTGIEKMQDYLSHKSKDETPQTTFRVLREIATNRLRKNRVRHSEVSKFYELLNKSLHIGDLIDAAEWKKFSKNLSISTNSEEKEQKMPYKIEDKVEYPLAEFATVLFNDYWNDKTTYGLGAPDGISQMRELYKKGSYDLNTFINLAEERTKKQLGFFGIKIERNPLVSEFYKILTQECKKSNDISTLVNTPAFQRLKREITRQSFLDMLFNKFWNGKSKLHFLPDGINQMRDLYHFNVKEFLNLDKFFEDCKLIAKQIPIYQNHFWYKINPIVAQFYRMIKNCPNLDTFVNSSYFKDLLELQKVENENNNTGILRVEAKLSLSGMLT